MLEVEVQGWDQLGDQIQLHYVLRLEFQPGDNHDCAACMGSRIDQNCATARLSAHARRTADGWRVQPVDCGPFGGMLQCLGFEQSRSAAVIRARLQAFVDLGL